MASASYRAVLCDLRSDQMLTSLPVQGVAFDDYVGKTGSLSGTIPVPDAGTAARVQTALLPGRTMLWLERGQRIAWGGPAWTRTPTKDARGVWSVPFQAATVDSYLAHRLLMDTQTSTGVDQFDIVRQLIDYAQASDGGDIGITMDYGQTSGVLRDRTYSRYDLPYIRDLIQQLAEVDGGFEWRIRCYRDGAGARVKELQLGYPKVTNGRTDLVLTSPGPVLAYSLPEDATDRANWWQSRGASINTNLAADSVPLMSTRWYFTGATDAGWPRLDGTSDHSSVTDLATLNAHAAADMVRAWTQHTIPTITVLLDRLDDLDLIGRTVRLRIRDIWYPDGLDERYRIVGLKVQPPERGRPETADLYLEAT